MAGYRLLGHPGWGSVIVEAQLTALGVAFDYEELPNLFTSDGARRTLAQHNPLPQVPTLLMPDGSVMTESAAITLHLADATGRDDFVPRADEPARPQFLRWLVFVVTSIYPTFTYADDPARVGISDAGAATSFRKAVVEHRCRLWKIVDTAAAADGPWFLGGRLSAIDVYVATMTHWRPGRAWFSDHTPRLDAIARRVLAEPRFGAVWRRNFPEHKA